MFENRLHTRHFVMLNLGHALDHYFILIFPTVVLFLVNQWEMHYSDLLKIGSLGVLAYGAGALPAGWMADKLGRIIMMTVFFIGIGISSILAGLTQNALQIGIAVGFIGLFASIYHPVGIAMVYGISDKPGRLLGINGVAGNLGLAVAAVITSILSEWYSWRLAFIIPGVVSVILGFIYWQSFKKFEDVVSENNKKSASLPFSKSVMLQIFVIIMIISTCGGLVFNSLTTGLPKILTEDVMFQSLSLSTVGGIATAIFVFASVAQLISGELVERFPPGNVLVFLTGLQVAALLYSSILSSPVIPLAITLFAAFGQIPVNDLITGQCSTDAWRSRFYAMKYTVGLGVASVAYWLIALTYEISAGFILLYQVLGISMFLATLSAYRLVMLNKSKFKTADIR